MRSFILAAALAGVVNALPAPQDIDFALAYALPELTYTTVSDATAQTVTYNPSTVFSAALSQITSSNTQTALDTATTTPGLEKRTACQPQPTGWGPVPTPDTVSAFAALPAFSSAAVNAPVPRGYTQTFSNLNGSSNAYAYMGYTTLETYDSQACADHCNKINGCISVNIYFERDPTLEPAAGCADPASTTNIKCVFWGGPLTAAGATNVGQWRDQFQVVIAGSNGYTNDSVAEVPGYGPATPLGHAAINAPYDQYGYNSYMGDTIFVGAFNAQLCADACTKKSQYNLAHPPIDGSPVQTCQFFNTYILYINNTNHVQGQYCAMYSESWPSSYATNVGQYNGSDHFLLEYSFSYSNATNPGAAAPLPAVYQAKNDVLSRNGTGEPYCSSVLGCTTPATTVPEPPVLPKYPSSIVSSACQLAVPSPTAATTNACGLIVDQFAIQSSDGGRYALNYQGQGFFTASSVADATLFSLDATCTLTVVGADLVVAVPTGQTNLPALFTTPQSATAQNELAVLRCQIGAGYSLQCTEGSGAADIETVASSGSGAWFLFDTQAGFDGYEKNAPSGYGVSQTSLTVLPVSM